MKMQLQSILLATLVLVVGTIAAPVSVGALSGSLSLRAEISGLADRGLNAFEEVGTVVERSMDGVEGVSLFRREDMVDELSSRSEDDYGLYGRSEDGYDLYTRALIFELETRSTSLEDALYVRHEEPLSERPYMENQRLAARSIKSFFKKIWHGIKKIGGEVISKVASLVRREETLDARAEYEELQGRSDVTLYRRDDELVYGRALTVAEETQLTRRSIGSFFKKVWHGIKSTAQKVWHGVKSAVSNVANTVAGGVENKAAGAILSKVIKIRDAPTLDSRSDARDLLTRDIDEEFMFY